MRQEGVRLHRELPGTVLSVEEALSLAFGEIDDPLNRAEVEALVARINAENTRREDEREAWEAAPAEVKGVTLTPGQWYAVAERVGYRGEKTRTFRFCNYRGRREDLNGRDNPLYLFTKWSQAAAKKFDRYNSPEAEQWRAASMISIEPVEPTEALLLSVEYKSLRAGTPEATAFLDRVTG